MTDITNKQNETQGHKAPAPALGTRTYTSIHALPSLRTQFRLLLLIKYSAGEGLSYVYLLQKSREEGRGRERKRDERERATETQKTNLEITVTKEDSHI